MSKHCIFLMPKRNIPDDLCFIFDFHHQNTTFEKPQQYAIGKGGY